MADKLSNGVNGKKDFFPKVYLFGCLLPLLTLVLICIFLALFFSNWSNKSKPPEFISDAEEIVEKNLSEIKRRQGQDNKKYDIDSTAGALYSIEKALSDAKNFKDLTEFIVQKDSENVAGDVQILKYKIFNVYKDVLESEDKIEELDSIYRVTMGSINDLVGLLGTDFSSGIGFDREQARKIWEKRVSEVKMRDKIQKRLQNSQEKMLDVLFDYARLNSKYMKEWDELCAVRDRAYLAFYERDWDAMIASSQKAVEMAPDEREAHVLLALALLERGNEADIPGASAVIEDIMKRHQNQDAPAYLLRGVISLKSKDYDKASLDFDQAAAYYPKQQGEVTEKLSLYKKRDFLNRSKEGRVIVNTYRGIMGGSGYFSPDFQKARVHLAKSEKEKAKEKIFDHFSRRRLQGQWDKVLTDFIFCRNYLGTEVEEISKDEKIDLAIEPAWITNSIIVRVNNKSPRDIHNVTILLCVRFTDMFMGDYISFPFGESVAVIPAGQSFNFGRENINEPTKESLGTIKKWKDIIEYGAVLISDETVTWVPPVKNEEAVSGEDAKTPGKFIDPEMAETAKKALKIFLDQFVESAAKEKDGEKAPTVPQAQK